jgi:glutamyl-tRNA reductase
VALAKRIFGTLDGRKILLIGAGKMSELSARYLKKNGATDLRVINRTLENAQGFAKQLGGTAYPFEQRWQHLVEADIVISSTSCPHPIFSRDEAEVIWRERDGRQLLLIDIAVPRDIDPAVRDVHGIFLYDIDDLENVVKRHAGIAPRPGTPHRKSSTR